MSKAIIKLISEQYGKMQDQLEVAQINTPRDSLGFDNKLVLVFAGDRTSMIPHFHYLDEENTFHVEVQIENMEELNILNLESEESQKQPRYLSWDGLMEERRVLKKWLDERNGDLPEITNYDAIKIAWNQNNR